MRLQSREYGPRAILLTLVLGMALCVAGMFGRLTAAQAAPQQTQAASDKPVQTDDLQRSANLDTYKLLADAGAARGENIYFFKCWMCHNEYAKGGPYLKDLYQHSNLMSGDPVNDETVTAKIKDGGPGMPSFRTTLSDADIADLRAYRAASRGEPEELCGSPAGTRRRASECNSSRPTVSRRLSIRMQRESTNFPRCKREPTPCGSQRLWYSSPTGGIRSRLMERRSWTILCSTGFPRPKLFLRRPRLKGS
jgi:mono/diheme cytochrome c family protein